jgi:subtilase family serine protease
MPLAAPNLLMMSSNIGFNPPNPVEGDQVIVSAVVLNNGATTASDITLQLLDLTDGTGIPVGAPQVIAAIAPGSSDATQIVYHTDGKVGDRKLQVVVDPNNFIAESNEEDNQTVSTLVVAAAPAPNLNVLPGNIKFDPPTPEQGDLVTITVALLNDGSATANDVLVQLTDVTNGVFQPIGAERTIDAIDAGSSATIQLLYEASGEPGERAIQVAVDPANIVRESNEGDNSAVKSLTITAPIIPNLVVQPSAITFTPPNPIDGDPVTVTVTVLNNGTGVADNILVSVVDATDGGAEPIDDPQSIATLPAGGSATVTVSYLTSGKAGDRRILVTIDPDNVIEESEERDNVAVKTLRVLSESERPPAQPNLVVKAEAIQFNPITTTAGSPVTVTVTVTNAGTAEAVDVTVQFADATGGGAELIGRTLLTGTLPAGRSGRTRIVYDTTGKIGKRDIQVTADPDNTITELDESDNQATRSITVTNGSAVQAASEPVALVTLDQPNLVVLDEEIAVYSPDYVASENGGDQVTIEVTVLNTGVRDAHNIGVQFLMMTNRGWEQLGDKQMIEHIAPGSGVTTTVDYDLNDQLGFREVRVLVDPDNAISEANEADNRASKVIEER